MSQQISYQIENSLYLSINDRCTLVCEFCPKTRGDLHVKGYDLTMDHRPSAGEIIESVSKPSSYKEIVFCGYGEPTLRLKTLLEVGAELKKQQASIRLNTDGLGNLVHKRNILPDLAGVVDSVSVSLNAQNAEIYNKHCQPQLPGSYQAMLEFLRLAPTYISHVTATAINGLQGVDIAACRKIAENSGVGFRQRELDLVG